ncbi:MAG TPA: nuclear transport factor 2 family protein [Chitinophaga sp.]|uniref:nuclear transport factor 2 family protein n=1 Tax=Chitinophaga sp. TaxID=1869181 RepID=UPI002C155BB2|nr:nuclear transport factor 2 family protein [Chitinophaga sp.]HVI46951.1 nuclear transport factor 2 family protein [Chitinophaga sp.]
MEDLNSLAQAWLDAWNAHDLEAILSHYADDIVFYSPFIKKINNDPSGCIRGKEALRTYFSRALTAYPELHFELYHIMEGVNSVVLHYKSINNLLSAETMIVKDGKVVEVRAHYK